MNHPDNLLVKMTDISKSFSGVQVLSNASLTINSGEIHALMGANGAGKSTLMKILTGVYSRDSGEVLLRTHGQLTAVNFLNPRESQHAGIGIVHQELILMDNLTISENICLGNEFLNKSRIFINEKQNREFSKRALERVGLSIDVNTVVGTLSPAEKQLIEIAKVLASDAKVLILDEPTTSLSNSEAQRLLERLVSLKAEGIAIVYISHRMDEIFRISDQITVMKDGHFESQLTTSATSRPELIQRMLGRSLQESYAQTPEVLNDKASGNSESQAPILRVSELTNKHFRSINFELYPGQILGLFGLVGAGRSELASAIFGVDDYESGSVTISGEPIRSGSVQRTVAAGISLVPEDRKLHGLILDLNVRENIELAALSLGKVSLSEGQRTWDLYQKSLGIKASSSRQISRTLSGGNQQKVVLGKWLATDPKLLILDEPTRGVDVGAKQEIYALIKDLAAKGLAVLMISSEIEEIRMLSDRVMVMREGEISFSGYNNNLSDDLLLDYAMGGLNV